MVVGEEGWSKTSEKIGDVIYGWSYSVIRQAFKRLPEFSTTINRKYKIRQRHYSVSFSKQFGEIDLAFLKEKSQGYSGTAKQNEFEYKALYEKAYSINAFLYYNFVFKFILTLGPGFVCLIDAYNRLSL